MVSKGPLTFGGVQGWNPRKYRFTRLPCDSDHGYHISNLCDELEDVFGRDCLQ